MTRINLIAGGIILFSVVSILYNYDTMRLDFYFILAGVIVSAASFAAGWHEAKEKYRHCDFPDNQVEPLVRAFWRRTHRCRAIYQPKELPRPLPLEIRAHMLIALTVLKRKLK